MTDKAPERIFLPPIDQVPFEDWNLLSEKLDGYDTEYIRADIAPAVKQLEWVRDDENAMGYRENAPCQFGMYWIEDHENNGEWRTYFDGFPHDEFIGGGDNESEAKAAAQADFKRRVRECLV